MRLPVNSKQIGLYGANLVYIELGTQMFLELRSICSCLNGICIIEILLCFSLRSPVKILKIGLCSRLMSVGGGERTEVQENTLERRTFVPALLSSQLKE